MEGRNSSKMVLSDQKRLSELVEHVSAKVKAYIDNSGIYYAIRVGGDEPSKEGNHGYAYYVLNYKRYDGYIKYTVDDVTLYVGYCRSEDRNAELTAQRIGNMKYTWDRLLQVTRECKDYTSGLQSINDILDAAFVRNTELTTQSGTSHHRSFNQARGVRTGISGFFAGLFGRTLFQSRATLALESAMSIVQAAMPPTYSSKGTSK